MSPVQSSVEKYFENMTKTYAYENIDVPNRSSKWCFCYYVLRVRSGGLCLWSVLKVSKLLGFSHELIFLTKEGLKEDLEPKKDLVHQLCLQDGVRSPGVFPRASEFIFFRQGGPQESLASHWRLLQFPAASCALRAGEGLGVYVSCSRSCKWVASSTIDHWSRGERKDVKDRKAFFSPTAWKAWGSSNKALGWFGAAAGNL